MAGNLLNDVIVIGSGPAGCAAAITCYQAGLNVLLVTEEDNHATVSAYDIAPLESIHPGVTSLLSKLKAEESAQIATRSLFTAINTGNTSNPLGEDNNGIWHGQHINRDAFNAHLLRHVQDLGIQVKFNTRVENFLFDNNTVIGIRSGAMELPAKYTIDASGKKGIAGKKLNFRRKFYSQPLLCWTGISEISGSFPFDVRAAHFIPFPKGWTWLAPQPPDYCSWTRLSATGEKSLLPPDELKHYTTIGKIHFANMRWRLYRPVCKEGILLCGDAAGILDPAAGQGIFNALHSGIIAATIVTSCMKEPDLAAFHLAYYDNWFLGQFEMKVRQLKEYYKEHGIDVTTKNI